MKKNKKYTYEETLQIKNIKYMSYTQLKNKFNTHVKLTNNKAYHYYHDKRNGILYIDYENTKEIGAYINTKNQIQLFKILNRQ